MSRRPGAPRVLMVLEGPYPPARGGGAEAQVRTLGRALRAHGVAVTVVAPLTAHAPQAPVSRVDGVPVCRLRYPRMRWIGGPALWLALARFLVVRRHRYDVWHVHVARQWGVVCALLGPWLGKRVLIKVSGSWDLARGPLAPQAGPGARLAARCLRRADHWQAISQRIAATLRALGIPASRIAAIPNAVDTARFGRVPRNTGSAPRFLFVGRLVWEKGLPTLLAAVADIASEFPDAQLTIAGTGRLRASLEADVDAVGLRDRIHFTGHRDDIEALLAEATIGVLPSTIEGLSNTLLEGMAAGLPMVASRISGNEDFVRHGDNGWLFEAGDRVALAACLRAAAALPVPQRLAMGDRARARVARQAGTDEVLARLLAVYAGAPATAQAAAVPGRSA
jgi:glycosyltransferase involved in cell wall biosynthesis